MAQFRVRLAERSKGKVVVDDYIVFEAEDEQAAAEQVVSYGVEGEGDTVEVAVEMLGDGDSEPELVDRRKYSTRAFNAGKSNDLRGYRFVKGTVKEAAYDTKIEFEKPLA